MRARHADVFPLAQICRSSGARSEFPFQKLDLYLFKNPRGVHLENQRGCRTNPLFTRLYNALLVFDRQRPAAQIAALTGQL
jgi:hypothetical protein